jgi:ribonuclease BN (tRNA processing enzyme)
MRIRVLGSGTIIPCAGRRPTALLVEWNGETVLFDCGPGALDAVEESGRSFRDVRRIFLTHYHLDHTLDVGRLLAALRHDELYPTEGRIALYGPAGLEEFLTGWIGLYRGAAPERDILETKETGGGTIIEADSCRIDAAEVDHGDMPALAYRIEDEGGSIVYTGDTGYDARLVDLAAGADLLVSECSFPDERESAGHLSPATVGRIASEAAVGRVLLVHLYPAQFREPSSAATVTSSVRRRFRGPVEIADDGMEILIERN